MRWLWVNSGYSHDYIRMNASIEELTRNSYSDLKSYFGERIDSSGLRDSLFKKKNNK